jgi:hypothetical protein
MTKVGLLAVTAFFENKLSIPWQATNIQTNTKIQKYKSVVFLNEKKELLLILSEI